MRQAHTVAVFRNKARGWWQMFKNAPPLSITRTVLCGYVELWSSTSRILDDYASKATEHPRFHLCTACLGLQIALVGGVRYNFW